jgi:hypothetical protein
MRNALLMLAAAVALGACAATGPSQTSTGLSAADRAARRAELAPQVEGFVNEIAAPGNEAGMARWNREVCPQVPGLSKEQGEFVLARISEVARAAGVPLAGESCRPNLFIFVTDQPQQLLDAMEAQKFAFVFGMNARADVIRQFIDTPQPVRVWYNTITEIVRSPVPIDAQDLIVTAPVISRAFVIVDRAHLQQVSDGQLADYVAMVGLAEVKPAAHVGNVQTVLSLFDVPPQAALPGMTDWDRAFLKSLYETEQSGEQRGELASTMVREIVPEPLEQVIIAARKERLSKLHQKIEESEDAFYKAYNKENTEAEYQVNCRKRPPTGSHIDQHVCTPAFVDRAYEDEAGAFLGGYAPPPPPMALIAEKIPAYEKHVREVIAKNPKLIAALRDYDALNKHYEAVRKAKFKGRWIVWD